MSKKHFALLVAVCGFLSIALPAFAHHSFSAEFDGDKEFVVKGVLTKIDWTNPHIHFYVDVKDESGNIATYDFASGPPNVLHRAGVRKEDWKIGEAVTVTAAPAKDGSKHLGWFKMIRYPDGHFFVYRNGSE